MTAPPTKVKGMSKGANRRVTIRMDSSGEGMINSLSQFIFRHFAFAGTAKPQGINQSQ